MLDQAETEEALLPLARPTLDAFASARKDVNRMYEPVTGTLSSMESRTGGTFYGVNFWALFATHLIGSYQGLVDRDSSSSDASHRWFGPENGFYIHLKSNIEDFCSGEVTLEHFPKVDATSLPLVALTWEHMGPDRVDPAFVHIDSDRPIWQVSVKKLAEKTADVMRPPAPTLGLKLKARRRTRSELASDQDV